MDKKIVERPLDDVVLAVHDNALRSRPDALKGKDFDCLGKEKFFLLPQTQEQSIIWPGYNTQALDYKHYKDGKVTLNIKPVEMPEGAQVGLFTAEGFGKVFTPLINSAEGDYSIETTFASHTHTNWAFTKPGIYKLEVTYSATTTEGKDISSAPQTLTVAAGDAAIKDCAKSKDGNEGEGTPSQETRSPEISQAITSLVARKTRRPLCPSSRACGGSCFRLSWPSFSKVSSTSTTITATKLRRGSLAYFPARKDTLDCTPHHHALLRARTCARTIHC